jgi:DNA invertase Pin-like site-specific DNA recombinase
MSCISIEIERELIVNRTREALARKKAEGIKLGRPFGSKSEIRKLDGTEQEIKEMLEQNMSQNQIAERLRVNRKTLSRFIKEKNIKI